MLSNPENDHLTKVTGEAPMGQMMRRYWVPACLSAEVADPEGAPLRTQIVGVPLVVFRDGEGRVGILDEHCPHRLGSLALGRNEEGGLCCVCHGWKFDVTGACMEMPNEPPGYAFRDRIRTRSYPVREAGGLVWTYLGPTASEPPFPDYD